MHLRVDVFPFSFFEFKLLFSPTEVQTLTEMSYRNFIIFLSKVDITIIVACMDPFFRMLFTSMLQIRYKNVANAKRRERMY